MSGIVDVRGGASSQIPARKSRTGTCRRPRARVELAGTSSRSRMGRSLALPGPLELRELQSHRENALLALGGVAGARTGHRARSSSSRCGPKVAEPRRRSAGMRRVPRACSGGLLAPARTKRGAQLGGRGRPCAPKRGPERFHDPLRGSRSARWRAAPSLARGSSSRFELPGSRPRSLRVLAGVPAGPSRNGAVALAGMGTRDAIEQERRNVAGPLARPRSPG